MRRTLAAAVVAAALVLPVLPGPTASAGAGERTTSEPTATSPQAATDAQARAALATARRLLLGDPSAQRRAPGNAARPDVTLALRDLYLALPRLDGDEREEAEAILARPTDGASDRMGDGYTVPASRKCGKTVCVHYVTSTADAAPSASWVNFTLKIMGEVYTKQVKKMGFRKPLSDKPLGASRNGGNGKFDVYLKDLGGRGVYGYCVAEAGLRGKKYQWRAISYCVLDNDFARAQFNAPPKRSLRATAAHEFFHAVQYSYDYGEDRWFLESTATWMEERVFDDVNDNRQYLPSSQVRAPWIPLDTFTRAGSMQYGNWVFWEYLSHRFGNGIVRDVLTATAPHGKRNSYSTATLKKKLKRKGGFSKVYRSFAAANLFPRKAYPEGKSWPSPALAGNVELSKARKKAGGSIQVDHLAAQHARVRPAKGLSSKRWMLGIKVDAPAKKTSPNAVITVQKKNGKLARKTISLNKKGKGKTRLGFSSRKVRSVTVSLVNASTRFRCYKAAPSADPSYSCQGIPRDDNGVFKVAFVAYRR
jgi:hypothetical protein